MQIFNGQIQAARALQRDVALRPHELLLSLALLP
jgi:hypothetical protein